MLKNRYSFNGDKPNFQVRLLNWANGEDKPFYWRSVLVTLGFAVAIGVGLYFAWELSYDQLLLLAGNAFVSILIVSVCLVLGVGFLLSTQTFIIRYFSEHSVANGRNDNAKSIKYTLEVIAHARNWLVLYDYGEREAENIYSNAEVQAALLAKLSAPGNDFKLSMIFKKRQQEVGKLHLVRALKQWQKDHKASGKQVEIICGKNRAAKKYQGYNYECREFPDHYKINDLGYAYLTNHAEAASRRQFIYYKPAYGLDATRVSDCLDFHNAVIAKV